MAENTQERNEIDFRRGASKTTVLFIEKYENVDTIDPTCKILYKNPAYKEEQEIK